VVSYFYTVITTIKANKTFLSFVISSILFFAFVAGMLLFAAITLNTIPVYVSTLLYTIAALLIILSILVIYTFSRSLTGLDYDSTTGQITLKFFFKTDIILGSDIKSYSYKKFHASLSARGGGNTYEGDIIYLEDRKILVSEFTLQDHRPFDQYLEHSKVPYKGEDTDNTDFKPFKSVTLLSK